MGSFLHFPSQKFCTHFSFLPCVTHDPPPLHSPLSDYPTNIVRGIQSLSSSLRSFLQLSLMDSRDNVVGIAIRYGLDGLGIESQ
jgi:hypothetical protein